MVSTLPDLSLSSFLICGDDEYLVEKRTNELLAALVPVGNSSFDVERIDGRVDNLSETLRVIKDLMLALVSDGLFSVGDRVVVLRDPSFLSVDRILRSEQVKEKLVPIIKLIKDGFDAGIKFVVTATKYNATTAFFKAFSSPKAAKIDFGKDLKPRDRQAQASMVVTERLRELNLTMKADVMRQFLASVGTNSRQLVSEVDKLFNYTNGAEVTLDDVRAITSFGAMSEVWDLTDAFAMRNVSKLLQQLKLHLPVEGSIMIVQMLLSVINDIVVIREGIDRKLLSGGGYGASWSLPPEIEERISLYEKSPLPSGFKLSKMLQAAQLWTLSEARVARHYIVTLREEIVSRQIPEDVLVTERLLQAIGRRR